MQNDPESGQAMVEFAMVLPLLLLLLCAIINFGWIFGGQLLADAACREAARYTAIHYYDSSTDDDQASAAQIVAARAPTLRSPAVMVTSSASDGSVTVQVKSEIEVIAPLMNLVFPSGKFTVTSQCVMRLE